MLHTVLCRLNKIFRPQPALQPVPHVWKALSASIHERGITEPVLFLSFDCDTDLDIAAAKVLAYQLREHEIQSTFAVPGAQLVKGAEIFGPMADNGFEFMNHGALPHSKWDGQKYIPATFYNKMPLSDVAADIREGDRLVREITGKAPKGFRAPHFGCFQTVEQIDFMHQLCADLGYLYASTTMPIIGMERGATFTNKGIVEFPLTGSWEEPLNIPDSWSKLSDRVNFTLSDRFCQLWEDSLTEARTNQLPMLFCWYVDPAHVLGQPPFERAIDSIARSGIRTVNGTECMNLLSEKQN